MERFSREWWESIECVPGCANCCPKFCSHLTKDLLCDVHPKKLGVSPVEAEKYGRGMGCHASPIELFTYDVYCPAIVAKLEEEGMSVPHRKESAGVEMVCDYKKVMELTRQIRGF